MKRASTGSTALTEAGYGPPSNSGSSATVDGAASNASIISRPPEEVLKILTLPSMMRKIPAQASPSQKSICSGANRRSTERCASACSSLSLRLAKSGMRARIVCLPFKCSIREARFPACPCQTSRLLFFADLLAQVTFVADFPDLVKLRLDPVDMLFFLFKDAFEELARTVIGGVASESDRAVVHLERIQLQLEVAFQLVLHRLTDVDVHQLGHVRRPIEKQDPFDQRLGVFHLGNGFFSDVIGQLIVVPVLAHLCMKKVLVDRRQLLFEGFVQDGDDLGIASHGSDCNRQAPPGSSDSRVPGIPDFRRNRPEAFANVFQGVGYGDTRQVFHALIAELARNAEPEGSAVRLGEILAVHPVGEQGLWMPRICHIQAVPVIVIGKE